MAAWRLRRSRCAPWRATRRRSDHLRPFTAPLLLPAHGALGVWDEVAVGALLVGCAIAYAVWFFVSGRREEPPERDEESEC